MTGQTGRTGPAIDFYFDFLSPYAYLANHRLGEIALRHDATVIHRPIDLGRAKRAIGNVGPGNRDMPVKLAHLGLICSAGHGATVCR